MQRKRSAAAPASKPTAEEASFKRGSETAPAEYVGFEAVVHSSDDPSPLMCSEINPSEVRASIKRKMAEAERIEDALATDVESETTAVGRPAFGAESNTVDRAHSTHYTAPRADYGPNSRQLTALWTGVAVAVAILLFPPGPNWPSIYYLSGQSILGMMPPLIAVAIVTGAAVYSLKDRSDQP